MNTCFLILCNFLFGFVASSKTSSSSLDTEKLDIIAQVHFDTEALISTQAAVIEEALKLKIFDEDSTEEAIRAYWRILKTFKRITNKDTFYRTMFKIGYVLNEAPAGFRFALLSEPFTMLPFGKHQFTVLSAPVTRKLYGILDVVKSLYESGVLNTKGSTFAGIFLSRPTYKPEFELQFVVLQSEEVKIELSSLLRHFGLPDTIKERNEEVGNLQDAFYFTENLSTKVFTGEEVDPSRSEVVAPPRVGRARRPRSFNRYVEKSPEPELLLSLLPSIEELSPKRELLFERNAPLKLPQITKSLSVDSSISSLSDNTNVKTKKRNSWSEKGHSNPHLGRRATYALIPQGFKSSTGSSSSDLSIF